MGKRIILTGATGLIGSHITKKLVNRGDKVVVFTRSPEKAKSILPGADEYVKWNYDKENGELKNKIDGADGVIHLAGKNLMANRWNEKHKKEVYDSRIIGTENLVNIIANTENKPKVFVCASATGYYDDSVDKVYDEKSESGKGFISKLTVDWEKSAAEVEKYGVRRVSIRTGIVLDKNEGALARMITPFKFFVGGPIGSGKQWMSWIHIEDIAGLFIKASDDEMMNGAYNGTAPNPVKMKKFAGTIGEVMHRPAFFTVPAFILRIILGEGADAVVKGSKIIPGKTIEAGYEFKYAELKKSLENILQQD